MPTSQILELVSLLALGLAAASGGYSLWARAREWRRMKRRLYASLPDDPDLLSRGELILGEWTPALAAQVPLTDDTKAELNKELRAAGYYRQQALLEYAAVRTLLVVPPLVGACVLALLVEPDQIKPVLIGGIVAALLGYSLPRLYVFFQAKLRGYQIESGLPMAVDMVALCLSAGQNILSALERVAREMKVCHPILAAELEIVRRHAELRSLPFALEQLAGRVAVAEVRNLALILIQAERLGTDTGTALMEYATHLRTTLRQRADAKANKTMFWLLFPMLLCFWIPAAIVLIGPAVLEFQESRKSTTQEWKNARQELQTLKPTQPEASPGQAP